MGNRSTGGASDSASIGAEVILDSGVTVDANATVAGRVRVLEGSFIGAGSVIEGPRTGEPILIGPAALVGAGAVVSVSDVGREAVIRPGAVVTRPVPVRAVVEGNPARVLRIRPSGSPGTATGRPDVGGSPRGRGRRERLVSFTFADDMRGALVAGEVGKQIPFEVKRFFMVFGVPGPEVRGEHAHLECHQLLVAAAGSLEVICDDGERTATYRLDTPSIGLHIPPMIWGIQHRYSDDAVLLVLASRPYEAGDYIRDYAQFRERAGRE